MVRVVDSAAKKSQRQIVSIVIFGCGETPEIPHTKRRQQTCAAKKSGGVIFIAGTFFFLITTLKNAVGL